jgi:lipoprotein-anchoring transpeptidase ErfK/SrfK
MTASGTLLESNRSSATVNPYSLLRLAVLGGLLVAVLALAVPADAAEHARHSAAQDQRSPTAHRQAKPRAAQPPPLTVDAVNDARFPTGSRMPKSAVLRAQILLDRAHFSPGEIDGETGSNLERALVGFQRAHGLQPTGILDAPTWDALQRDATPVLVDYTIAADDVEGPFVPIPRDMAAKAQLPAMGYTSPLEGIGERFHASPKLIALLNPGKRFDRAGETITVPNVAAATPLIKGDKSLRVVVSKSQSTVAVVDPNDRVLAQFPASVGSEHDPLPIGDWKINGVARNPKFHYNPELFWDADPGDRKATIPPGPNNPVGVVWIDLSKPHYGIHGTPEPQAIGKTQSHGCIRLTNWDAAQLADVVFPGMPAVLTE